MNLHQDESEIRRLCARVAELEEMLSRRPGPAVLEKCEARIAALEAKLIEADTENAELKAEFQRLFADEHWNQGY